MHVLANFSFLNDRCHHELVLLCVTVRVGDIDQECLGPSRGEEIAKAEMENFDFLISTIGSVHESSCSTVCAV